MFNQIKQLDLALFHWINSTLSNPVLDTIILILTEEHIIAIPLLCVWLGLMIFGGKRGRIAGLILLIGVGLTDYVSAQIIKPWVGRIRPSHELGDAVNLLMGKGGKFGFPSNYAANTFMTATILGHFYHKLKPTLFIIATFVAFSRIYAGVHYPLDVAGGALLGYLFGQVILSIWFLIQTREIKKERRWIIY